jgi:protocatechuate 3,4-dioxygenase, beta subunit
MHPSLLLSTSLLVSLACISPAQQADTPAREVAEVAALPECEWCGAPDAPAGALPSTMTIAGPAEPGERLIVSGTVYQDDGRTPAAGVLVYAYHTNAAGVYAKRGDETGNGRRHGYLRGWLRTGADGRYRVETVKPGTYPSRGEPAHIHFTLTPPGQPERYIDDVVFEGDALLTAAHRARLRQRGGSGIVRLSRDSSGVLHATRDIYLGRQ